MPDIEVVIALEKAFKALEDFKGELTISFDRGTVRLAEPRTTDEIDLEERVAELLEENEDLESRIEDLIDDLQNLEDKFNRITNIIEDY